MNRNEKRLMRERHTIAVMIAMYCQANHSPSSPDLCEDCAQLERYALQRIDHCPYQGNKPTCANCPIHCYQSEMRTKVREVMRFAGPRMVFRHPLLAINHLMDGRRNPPISS
jgi:superfamily II helicase